MGHSITQKLQKCKDINILRRVVCKKFKINESNFTMLSPEEIAAGKSFPTADRSQPKLADKEDTAYLWGGIPAESRGDQVIGFVKRKHMRDEAGRKAFWSDGMVVTKDKDGKLGMNNDYHNFDQHDRTVFVDKKLVQDIEDGVLDEYAKVAVEEFVATCPVETIASEWVPGANEDEVELYGSINSDNLTSIPQANLL